MVTHVYNRRWNFT